MTNDPHDVFARTLSVSLKRTQGTSGAGRSSNPTLQLGERDDLLMCDLAIYGFMLPEQIQALYFAGRSRRRMNQRLQQLVAFGLLVRRPLPLGLSAALPSSTASYGIPLVYRLGSRAAPIVAPLLEWDVAEVRRQTRQGSPTAIAHTLEIVRLRLQAEQAVRERNAPESESNRLALEYAPERLLRHSYELRAPGGLWRDETFKPDSLIKLAWANGAWRHWFVEIDRGHTSSAAWGTKADIAVRYRKLGLFQKRYAAEGFRTLIVTTGARRRTHLQQLLTRHLCPEDAACFGVTTFADVAAQGLLASIWHLPGQERAFSLETWTETAVTGEARP